MRAGFSLFEMSIVLVVISLLTAGGLTIGQSAIKQSKYKATDEKLEELIDALAYYYKLNGHLPCPAPLTAKLGEAEYGREILRPSECHGDPAEPSGTERISLGGGVFVRIGAIPTRDMMLPDIMMKDEFENRIRYAVFEKLTNSAGLDTTDEGAITITDGEGVSFPNTVAFVLVSHGNDGRGATSFLGFANTLTCSGSNKDVENCDDNDAIFVDGRFSEESVNFYDDRIRWMKKRSFQLYADSL